MSKEFSYILKNVKYDNSYKNMPIFSSVAARDAALIGDAVFSPLFNFAFGNGMTTKVTINDYNVNDNYIIIKERDEDTTTHRFYFIVDSVYNASNQWTLTIYCDVITTYMAGVGAGDIAQCMIQRAHCDRFARTPVEGKYFFNVSSDSDIIKKEIDIDKPRIERRTLAQVYSDDPITDDWLRDNVICWMYLFLDASHSYTMWKLVDVSSEFNHVMSYEQMFHKNTFVVDNAKITNDYSVCCVPILKDGKEILFYDAIFDVKMKLNNEGVTKFIENNNDKSYIYNIKFSTVSPIDWGEALVENGNLVYNKISSYIYDDGTYHVYGFTMGSGMLRMCERTPENDYFPGLITGVQDVDNNDIFYDVNISFPFKFTPEELKGNRSKEYEPKILSHCYNVTLRDSSGAEYVYNPLLHNQEEWRVLYNEPNSITNNNYYARVKPAGLYNDCDDTNWKGITNTVDNSIPIANDNLASFLANNKNFLLTKAVETIISAGTNVAEGKIASAIIGAGQSIFGSLTTLDNIGNTNRNIQNANNTASLTLQVNAGIHVYLDIESAYDVDIDKLYETFFRNGYRIEKYGNPYNYMFSRHNFNYIQCDIEYINKEMPQWAKNKIKNIFAEGIRLWHNYENMYNYSNENYEVYII